jgi:Bacterial Ig-like domain
MMRAKLIVLAALAALVVGTVALAGVALAGVALAGVAWAESGTPRVVSTVPPDDPTGVGPNTNVKAKFSETMRARSINGRTSYLIEGHFTYEGLNPNNDCTIGCIPVSQDATVRYNAETRTAILDPSATLDPNTKYTAVVEGGGDGDHRAVKDRGGPPMARDYIWHFTTGSGGPSPGPI